MVIKVKMDRFGKIFFPKNIREKVPDNEFEVVIENDHIELIPIRNPLELFGTLRSVSTKKLEELHGEEHDLDA